jgi:hypothetical protein
VRAVSVTLAMVAAVALFSAEVTSEQPRSAFTWRFDNLQNVGGYAVRIIGKPSAVDTEIGPAIAFDGAGDGLFLDVNPLEGLTRFTLEIVLKPAPDGSEEQRFVHIEEERSGNRVLIELRRHADTRWTLDTYLRSGEAGLTLLDHGRTHAAGSWYVAALTYDGKTMSHFVNGRQELSGVTRFAPLGRGRTSIGVRLNRVSWFKGLIHSLRVTPDALPPERLLTAPPGGVS